MRSVISRVFRYAIATARADRDLAADLRGALTAPKVKHHAAITTRKETGAPLRAIEGYTGHEITAIALRLTPHVYVRPGELRQAEWTEIDVEDAVWSIPADKLKLSSQHSVPLSRAVIDLFEALPSRHVHRNFLSALFLTSPCSPSP